jgi:aryl-alcohol dehydrogenase-like predicted oxidoreductase
VTLPAAAAGELELGSLSVNRIGFGARFVQDPTHHGPLLRRALELGVTLLDTADVYGNSEEAIAGALHPYPDGLVIATKGGQTLVDGTPTGDGRPEYLREACERSLRSLRVDTIDLYQLHMPDPNVPIEESVGALEQLRQEGKVREIGVSNVFGPQLEAARRTAPIVSVQNRYSVKHRESQAEIALCEREGMAYMPWWPLAGGELANLGPQRALAWLLQRSPSMLPIPGTSSVEHLEENVAAASLTLTPAEITELEAAASPNVPESPV